MKDMLTGVLVVLMMAAVGAALVGLVSPRTVRMQGRVPAFLSYGFLAFLLLMGIGFLNPGEDEIPDQPSDEFPVLPGSGADPVVSSRADSAQAREEDEELYVLRTDSARVRLSANRVSWDRAYLVAELPSGTEVRLLERAQTPNGERCQVRTTFAPVVTGWVMCSEVQR
jgi:hypothetical protein